MLNSAKSLVYVLAIMMTMFAVIRPACIQMMSVDAFTRRRNIWLALTAAAFLSPNFWVYVGVAIVVLLWAGANEENPAALFLIISYVIPNVSQNIPIAGINQLFDLSPVRLLTFVILLPAMFRMKKSQLTLADWSLLAFIGLQVVLFVPYESFTNTMRRSFLLVLDYSIILYVFCRLDSLQRVRDVLASYWMMCVVLAAIAVFESLRGWLLYPGIGENWGSPVMWAYIDRGGALRAQASTGHALNLGHMLALAIGFHLYLKPFADRKFLRWLSFIVLCAGLYVTYSRGGWVTAMLAVVLALALQPHGMRRVFSLAIPAVIVIVAGSFTTVGQAFIDKLPFIGNAYQDTVEYRQQLADLSWTLIKLHPYFGDPFVLLQMESLRQGQGIIDLVNAYLTVALFNGGVGVALFVSTFAIAIYRAGMAFLRVRNVDADAAAMGASLLAVMIASLVFIATAGYGAIQYIEAGLLVSFATAVAARTFAAPAPVNQRVARPHSARRMA